MGQIAWEDAETLAFCYECWAQLEAASLHPSEREMFKQALRAVEKFDAETVLRDKATRAAEILRSSKAAICFTGAGMSTAAGLGDYRGKRGKWTLEAQGKEANYVTEYEALRPTFAHQAVAKLVEDGMLARVISQNADGLHHLSGIPYSKLSEVHGCAFTERCPKCGARYVRNTYVPDADAEDYLERRRPPPIPKHIKKCRGCGSNHWTGRSCDACGGALHDTVVSFGDALEECVLGPAFEAAENADACLSLGSTMSIGPSNQVVTLQSGPLIVCVRQVRHTAGIARLHRPHVMSCEGPVCVCRGTSTQACAAVVPMVWIARMCTRVTRHACGDAWTQDTEMDGRCARRGVRAWGDCDDFMRLLMAALLGADGFAQWEQALAAKASEYDSRRPPLGSCKKRGDIFVKK